jgi:pimeloyl-ACP methyl ester carboxylesterase
VIERFLADRGLYYRVNSFDAARETLVFVHGVSGSSSAWRPYETRFESRFNLLSFDLRGHGRSRKYARYRDYAMPLLVDDLVALLDTAAIDRCVIISHSFAVLLTLEFLRAHCHRVHAAVLVSSDYDVGRSLPAKLLKCALAPIGLMDCLPLSREAGVHIDYARFPQSGDWNVRRMLADIGNTTWRIYLYCSKQVYAVHAEDLLPDLGLPVLLIHGERDSVFAVENSIVMSGLIPRAELVIIGNADHIVVLNRPQEVADAIERFLGSHLPATSKGDDGDNGGNCGSVPNDSYTEGRERHR